MGCVVHGQDGEMMAVEGEGGEAEAGKGSHGPHTHLCMHG